MKKRLIFIIVLGILTVNCGNSSNPETPNTPAGGGGHLIIPTKNQ